MSETILKKRNDNSFRVEFPDFPSFSATPFKAILHQEMGKHDVLELTFHYYDRFYYEVLATGTPVKFVWSNGDYKQTFFGYISTVSTVSQKTSRRPTQIVCIGATFPLKRRGNEIWKNKTASQIIEDIAKTFKLKAKVKDTKAKFNQQSMVGHTYWQKMNELARRCGYALHAVNTTIYFKPIDDMIKEFSTSIPILEFAAAFNAELVGESPLLDYFKPVVGDYVETGVHKKTSKLLSGVNPLTGKVYKKITTPKETGEDIRSKNKDPLFVENDPFTVVESDAMSDLLGRGRASLGRLNISAKASAQGDPRIAPWRTVEIRGTGNATNGFWLVEKATHTMFGDGRYLVDFQCLTDGTGFTKSGNMRPSGASEAPTRNVVQEVISGTTKPEKTVLSSKSGMIKETDTGFNIVPRRWVGE